jgi:enoyl-CoA hydratase/carnithine racemase
MVHGPAYAGGCELALHCDFRIAADVARFAMPLARLGVMLPFPLAHKMVETVGPVHAGAILLDGRLVEARRAFEIGMVHQVVPAAELEAATGDLARWIAGHAPLALAGLKATIIRSTPRCDVDHADLDRMLNQVRQSADARGGRAGDAREASAGLSRRVIGSVRRLGPSRRWLPSPANPGKELRHPAGPRPLL